MSDPEGEDENGRVNINIVEWLNRDRDAAPDLISRAAAVAILREERDRMEALALRFKSEGNERMSHLMRIRANSFEMSAYMVEMMQ